MALQERARFTSPYQAKRNLNAAFEATRLPERPDYERADAFLVSARRRALSEELP